MHPCMHAHRPIVRTDFGVRRILINMREALTLIGWVYPPNQSHSSLSHPG